jgi:hypothetical protein
VESKVGASSGVAVSGSASPASGCAEALSAAWLGERGGVGDAAEGVANERDGCGFCGKGAGDSLS